MAEGLDLYGLALLLAVIALFGWYFWHVIVAMLKTGRGISDFLDSRSARMRAELDYEAKHGPRPLWYRLVQRLLIITMIVGAGMLIWMKFTGR